MAMNIFNKLTNHRNENNIILFNGKTSLIYSRNPYHRFSGFLSVTKSVSSMSAYVLHKTLEWHLRLKGYIYGFQTL